MKKISKVREKKGTFLHALNLGSIQILREWFAIKHTILISDSFNDSVSFIYLNLLNTNSVSLIKHAISSEY